MATLFVDKIDPQSGTSLTIGSSGDTVALTSGVVQSNLMYPSFVAYRTSSAQSLSNNTTTKCEYNTELFDTDSCYDNSTNYRFTPTVAGKYFVYHQVGYGRNTSNVFENGQVFIYKNGSNIASQQTSKNAVSNFEMASIHTICEMNGTSDYLEGYIQIGVSSGTRSLNTDLNVNQFGAYRIGS